MSVETEGRTNKLDWLAQNLRCVACGSVGICISPDNASCVACGKDYIRSGKSISFLSDDNREKMGIVDGEHVSYRGYDGNVNTILDYLRKNGGMVLDCGSGKKDLEHSNLVQLEIVDYPNVDILAVNQQLPFADDCFDAVFSLDVLEHVNDPMESAKEISRILKPGGMLYFDLPFLQAEHGYPHHYFNATRMGAQQLFRGLLDVEAHIVPSSGHPIVALKQVLDIYTTHLPPATSARFRALTVDEILNIDIAAWLKRAETLELPVSAQWLIASTTQGVFRKPMIAGRSAASTSNLPAVLLPGFALATVPDATDHAVDDPSRFPQRFKETMIVRIGKRMLPNWGGFANLMAAHAIALLKGFNGEAYLAANPDVRDASMPPYRHWLRFGYAENRPLR